MSKTINEILKEQEGCTPAVDIMGNITEPVFDRTVPPDDFPQTFLDNLLNLIKLLTQWNK